MEVCKKRKRSQPQKRRVKVCNVCGSEGFSNAFIYCSRCSDTRVHQYCVGIPPGNLNDVDNWVCEYCPVTVGKESCTGHVIASASDPRSRCIMHAETLAEKSKNEMVVIPDQPEPLCFLYPLTCKEKSEDGEIRNCSPVAEEVLSTDLSSYQEENEMSVSPFMECPEALMDGQVLIVSSSGEIIIPGSSGIYDEISPQNAGDSPICCFLTYDEELEGQVSSFMEYPAEISRELVLLVKPAGEAFIEYGLSSHDGSHFQIIVSMENIGHEETRGSYKIAEEVLSTAPISSDYSSDYIKECERSGSSFMEYPESLMCGLVLVASPSGQLIICRSSDICDKFNPHNAEDSDTCHLLTYGVDREALASSFMEYPEEISRELVLRVKPTGEITIDFGEMKSNNLVSCKKTDVCFSDAPDEFSKLDVQDNVVFEHMFDASDSMDAAIQQADEDLDADDYESKHRMGNKKTTSPSSINYGYIPPIRSGCKRPRSKRYYKLKHGTSDKKTTSSSSINYGCIPPIKSGCKRPRSKRYYESKHRMGNKKTTSPSSINYGYIPPIRSGCKRPRSKRCKSLSSQARVKAEKDSSVDLYRPLELGIYIFCSTDYKSKHGMSDKKTTSSSSINYGCIPPYARYARDRGVKDVEVGAMNLESIRLNPNCSRSRLRSSEFAT